jgi:hypothetical protein
MHRLLLISFPIFNFPCFSVVSLTLLSLCSFSISLHYLLHLHVIKIFVPWGGFTSTHLLINLHSYSYSIVPRLEPHIKMPKFPNIYSIQLSPGTVVSIACAQVFHFGCLSYSDLIFFVLYSQNFTTFFRIQN